MIVTVTTVIGLPPKATSFITTVQYVPVMLSCCQQLVRKQKVPISKPMKPPYAGHKEVF
ncbi:hypothetical protein ACFSKI_09330 [Pseudogracilibacillus auburnensis]|uniref:hypothetical protein n=1 Tax=Pseudogracilibacillus auburnensis TaxID=1494959 RepID=UPI001B871E12|nr:hypothetical protein [Pseudogracilibacillus auburnensis]